MMDVFIVSTGKNNGSEIVYPFCEETTNNNGERLINIYQ